MALQFNPFPVPQRQNEPDLHQMVTNPILQGLQTMIEAKRQNQLMAMQQQQMQQAKIKDQWESRKFASEYGSPIDPSAQIGIATQGDGTGIARSSMMPGGMGQVGQPTSVLDSFNKWRAGGMKPAEARPEFIGALGRDERKVFQDQFKPQAQPKKQVIVRKDAQGNVLGFDELPEGYTSAGVVGPTTQNSGGVSPGLAYQMEKDQEKRTLAEKGKLVPGYSKTGDVEPEEIEVRKFRDSVAEMDGFRDALAKYKALIQQYGTMEPTNREVAGQMQAYAKFLQLKVKNLAQLGVLSASDIPFIEKQLPGPGFLKTTNGMMGALNTVGTSMENYLDSKARVLGYSREGQPSGGSDFVQIRDSSGGMHRIPRSNLDAAKKRDPGLEVLGGY